MHLDSCYIINCVRGTSLSVIFSTRDVNIDCSARCGWFPNMFRFSCFCFEIIELAYIHCPLKENFSVTLIKKGFTCISLICRELLCALGRTVNTKYKTRQLISFARFTSRTVPRPEENQNYDWSIKWFQQNSRYAVKLITKGEFITASRSKELKFTTAVTNKI